MELVAAIRVWTGLRRQHSPGRSDALVSDGGYSGEEPRRQVGYEQSEEFIGVVVDQHAGVVWLGPVLDFRQLQPFPIVVAKELYAIVERYLGAGAADHRVHLRDDSEIAQPRPIAQLAEVTR